MKLHNNSWLSGVFVIPWSDCNLLKSQGLIERARRSVGRPDLQKNGAFRGFQVGARERASDALAAVIGRHSQVQEFVFTGSQCTPHEETDNADSVRRHQQIEIQVPDRIPLRGVGTSRLNSEYRTQIAGLTAPYSRHRGLLEFARNFRPKSAAYILGA
jgi:hypothetical protein